MTLKNFFTENPKAAIGFSGGVDSAYLLYAAMQCGAQIQPYYIKTALQPEFELEDARRLAEQVGVSLKILEADALSCEKITENSKDRCYHCKRTMFGLLREQALTDGYTLLLDGTNASDDISDRPGMRALCELSVRSPLRECGLGKEEIRELSKKAGLFTWNKPAYACLATRIPRGRTITKELLRRVERAESALFNLGFSDFRVRIYGEGARIELLPEQQQMALDKRDDILKQLAPMFDAVMLDLKGR